MRKTVYVCTCDMCKKAIEDETKRFVLKLGVGDWNSKDHFEQKLDKDLCIDCYTTIFDMAEQTNTSQEEREFTATVMKRRLNDKKEKIMELYAKGMGYRDIAAELDMNPNTVASTISKCKKANGLNK